MSDRRVGSVPNLGYSAIVAGHQKFGRALKMLPVKIRRERRDEFRACAIARRSASSLGAL